MVRAEVREKFPGLRFLAQLWRYLRLKPTPMAKKRTSIRVHIWRTKRKGDDVWKVAIDDPGKGPLTELKTRYTRKHGAFKGACRKLKAFKNYEEGTYVWTSAYRGSNINFIYEKP